MEVSLLEMMNANKSQRCELKIYKTSVFAITILEQMAV
jgi:hypothetical protein